jgi:hypothetical protein
MKEKLEKYILDNFGKRCEVLDIRCPTCRAYTAFDTFVKYVLKSPIIKKD